MTILANDTTIPGSLQDPGYKYRNKENYPRDWGIKNEEPADDDFGE